MSRYRKFTEAEIATLVQCQQAGMTINQAAEYMGRIPRTVSGKASQLGLEFKAARKERSAPPPKPRHIIPTYTRPRSLTAMMMGDPPIERSALGQRGKQ